MPKNILVVDDDEQLRKMYARALGGQGYRFSLAACARHGLTLLAEGSYDLVITDFELGDGTGTEIMEASKGISTILITGSVARTELEVLASRYGLAAYFEKPFRLEDLLNKIRETVG